MDVQVPAQTEIQGAYQIQILARNYENDYQQVLGRPQTEVLTTRVVQMAARLLKEIQRAQVQGHCMVGPHYLEVVGNPRFPHFAEGQVLVLTSPKVLVKQCTGGLWSLEVGLLGKEEHQLVNLPPPAGLEKAKALESPPAARRTSCLSFERSFGAPSRAAVPSKSWRGPPG